MSKKYIMRGCPCYVYRKQKGNFLKFNLCSKYAHADTFCQDITDCVIKKIVQICETEIFMGNYWWGSSAAKDFARQILQLLDMQEVKE